MCLYDLNCTTLHANAHEGVPLTPSPPPRLPSWYIDQQLSDTVFTNISSGAVTPLQPLFLYGGLTAASTSTSSPANPSSVRLQPGGGAVATFTGRPGTGKTIQCLVTRNAVRALHLTRTHERVWNKCALRIHPSIPRTCTEQLDCRIPARASQFRGMGRIRM